MGVCWLNRGQCDGRLSGSPATSCFGWKGGGDVPAARAADRSLAHSKPRTVAMDHRDPRGAEELKGSKQNVVDPTLVKQHAPPGVRSLRQVRLPYAKGKGSSGSNRKAESTDAGEGRT